MDLAADIPLTLADFGEAVQLPGGQTATAIFDPVGDPSAPPGSEVGLGVRVSQQVSPHLLMASADAASLSDGDTITVRGAAYRVTRSDPDGQGMTTVRLQKITTDHPAGNRWR